MSPMRKNSQEHEEIFSTSVLQQFPRSNLSLLAGQLPGLVGIEEPRYYR